MSMKDELTQYLYNFCCIRYDQLRALKTLDAKKSTEYHMAAPWKIAVGCLIAWVVIFGIIELIFGKGYGADSALGLALVTTVFIITLDEREYVQNANAGKIIPKKAVVSSNDRSFCLLSSTTRTYQYSAGMSKFIQKFCEDRNPIAMPLVALDDLDKIEYDDFDTLCEAMSIIYQDEKACKDKVIEIESKVIIRYFVDERKSVVKEIIEKLKADEPFDVFAYEWMDYAYIALDLESQMRKA